MQPQRERERERGQCQNLVQQLEGMHCSTCTHDRAIKRVTRFACFCALCNTISADTLQELLVAWEYRIPIIS